MKPLLYLFLILCAACHNPKQDFQYPSRQEVADIVETIIKEKKLAILKDTGNLWTRPLASDLEKIIVVKETDTIQYGPLTTTLEGLLKVLYKDENFFRTDDSSYILSQNNVLKNIDLAKEFAGKYHLTTNAKEDKREENWGNSYYSFSVPIFSKDMKRAYIEMDENCRGLCGSGGYFLLEKMDGKWKIMDYYMLWIS